jgi:hypothetical protein
MNSLESTASDSGSRPPLVSRVARYARAHPVSLGLLALGVVLGAVGGLFLPIDAPPATRALGGAIAGFYFALFPLGERLFD